MRILAAFAALALTTAPVAAQVEIRGVTIAPPGRPGDGGIVLKSLLSTRLPAAIDSLRVHQGRVLARLEGGQSYRLTFRNGSLAREPVLAPDHGPPAADALPDAERSTAGDIELAYLIGPTTALRHGVLGDAIEATGIRVRWRDGVTRELRLDDGSVFEDRRVRLADINDDGAPEALVVRSTAERGASLAAYRLARAGIEMMARTKPLGQANRWLNPLGVADLDGDGRTEIVLVERPHLDGRLVVLRLANGGFLEIAALAGYSNHRIGQRNLGRGALLDVARAGRPQIIVPGLADDCLNVLALEGSRLRPLGQLSCGAPFVGDFAVADMDGDGVDDLVVARETDRIEVFLR
ncbi:MAG: hypothetical protein AB7F36_09265 [Reyranellaceae bacterium]